MKLKGAKWKLDSFSLSPLIGDIQLSLAPRSLISTLSIFAVQKWIRSS